MQGWLNVLPDGFQRVNTKCTIFARLASDVAFRTVALREDGEQNVVLSRHAEIGGQIGSGFTDECGLDQVVVLARRTLDALDGDFGVRVVVAIVVAYTNLGNKN